MRKIQSMAVANHEKICPTQVVLEALSRRQQIREYPTIRYAFLLATFPATAETTTESSPLVDLAKRAIIRSIFANKFRSLTRARIRNTRNPIGHCLAVW